MAIVIAMALAVTPAVSVSAASDAGADTYPIPENTTGEVFKNGLSNAYMGNVLASDYVFGSGMDSKTGAICIKHSI